MIKVINVYKDSRVMEMTSSSNLGLGVRTDNDVDLLRFTFNEMIVGTAQLLTSLTDEYGELVAFPLTLNQEENSYDIEVTKYLASQGNFTIQLEITTNGMIWHSKQAEVILDDCLAVGEGDMPSVVDNWLQNANIVLAEMEEATTGAEKVNLEVEEVDDTYEVTFTDRNGNETQATIYQGKNANVVGSYDTSDTNAYSTNYVNNQISTPLTQEVTNRQNADNELQSQIDAITVSSDVVDIVGTYQDLQNYDTQHIKANDIIKVLQDSTHNDALSYYRWVITQNVGSWVYVGSEGPFYTKSETDSLLNNKVDTTTFNTSQQAQDTLIANKVNTTTYNQGQATQDTKITNLENQVFGDETIEGEGTSITLDGTLKGQFNELDLKGNTSQDGTPTPTSPIPVNVVSGDNSITICGKNLFSGFTKGKGLSITTGKITDNNNGAISDYIPVDFSIHTNYYLSGLTDTLNSFIASYNSKKEFLGRTQGTFVTEWSLKSTSFPSGTPQGTGDIAYIIVYQYKSSGNTGTINDIDNLSIQLEFGSSATTFEPYNGDTYNIDLPVENLAQNNLVDETYNSLQITKNSDGSFTLNGNPTSSFGRDIDTNITLKKGTYTISANAMPSGLYIALDNTSETQLSSGTLSKTFILASDTTYTSLGIWFTKEKNYNVTIKLQLEKGSKANSYTPYGTTPIELCKIPNTDYEDTFIHDKTLDKWYLHKEIGKVVLNGSESWNRYGTSSIERYYLENLHWVENIGYCDYAIIGLYANRNNLADNNKFFIGNNSLQFRRDDLVGETTVTAFKSWLSTHNTEVYYVLATPTNTEITYQPLIDQLNAIEQAQSKENQTNISQVNNDLPFIISASAFLNNINGKIALLNKLTEV